MEVKIKKLREDAVIPTYAKPGDAGMDLVAVSYEMQGANHVYGTGLALEIPKGYVGLIYPRSSNRKTNAYLPNHVGIIDSGYRGEIMVTYKNRDGSMTSKPYEVGDKLAQIIIMPYPTVEFIEVDKLTETERGEGGHGSTGN